MPADSMELFAPAKLNLTLDITGLAPNGYHTLDMVMQTVSLLDTVTLRLSAHELTIVRCPPDIPKDERNLALKAAIRLCEYIRKKEWAVIMLDKSIPIQAGLGGGSADAAAVLNGLNELWGLGLSRQELAEVGLKLGSDVPFALAGGTARVRGIGEWIEPIQLNGAKPLWYLLAKPEGGVKTAEAYQKYDGIGAGARPQTERFIEALAAGDIDDMARFGGNALEKAAISILPPIGVLISEMRAAGAGYAAMTGSGSAVFGVFGTEAEAVRAKEKLGNAYWSAVAGTYPATEQSL